MRLVIHGKKLGVIHEMDASALVVCLDSGTPVADVDQNRYGSLNTTYYHATESNVR